MAQPVQGSPSLFNAISRPFTGALLVSPHMKGLSLLNQLLVLRRAISVSSLSG